MSVFLNEIIKYDSFLLLSVLFSLSFGFQAFTASFAMYCKSRFHFGPLEYGRVLSFCGIVWSSTNGCKKKKKRWYTFFFVFFYWFWFLSIYKFTDVLLFVLFLFFSLCLLLLFFSSFLLLLIVLLPLLKKYISKNHTLLIVGTCCLFCGRIVLALAYRWELLIFGELFVVFGAAVSFTLLR